MLTARRERFCQEYLLDLNGAAAARRAGYAVSAADVEGSRLQADPKVQARLAELMAERAARTRISADKVLEQLALWAFLDLSEVFNPDWTLKKLKEMSPTVRSGIVAAEVLEARGGGKARKIKFVDRLRALELIGRHLGMFTDKLQVKTEVRLEEVLAESWRQRDPETALLEP